MMLNLKNIIINYSIKKLDYKYYKLCKIQKLINKQFQINFV